MPPTDPTPHHQIPALPNVDDLPPMLDLPTAAALLGVSSATIYRLAAKDDALPVPVVTVGKSRRIPTAPLLALLGLTPVPGPATAADNGADAPDAGGAADPADTGPDGRGAGSGQDA